MAVIYTIKDENGKFPIETTNIYNHDSYKYNLCLARLVRSTARHSCIVFPKLGDKDSDLELKMIVL